MHAYLLFIFAEKLYAHTSLHFDGYTDQSVWSGFYFFVFWFQILWQIYFAFWNLVVQALWHVDLHIFFSYSFLDLDNSLNIAFLKSKRTDTTLSKGKGAT